MSGKAPAAKWEYVENGTEPEFNVNHITHEQADGGMVRVFCWKLIHRKYVLQYTAVVPGAALVQMGKQCVAFGAEAHNLTQWDDEFTEH